MGVMLFCGGPFSRHNCDVSEELVSLFVSK